MKLFVLLVNLIFLTNTGLSVVDAKRSKKISRDVNFWENVFSKYSSKQCVFHDDRNLDLVYTVKSIPKAHRRRPHRWIEHEKVIIRRVLNKLAAGTTLRKKSELDVYYSIPKRLRNKRSYLSARNHIRCQNGVKEQFSKSIKRSKKYISMIKKKLIASGLPTDLAYLPHLESGFNNRAHSKVGARGLWQLMPATAKQHMTVSRRRDDRVNVRIATDAAIKILNSNYKRTKSWPLAITGYNYGINGMVRAMKKLKTNDYDKIRERHRSKIFGFAAKNFYPSFLAVRNLAKKKL